MSSAVRSRDGRAAYQRIILAQAVAVVAALAVLAVACGGEDAIGEPVDGELRVLMKDNYFEPKRIVVPAGETIVVTAVNAGVLPHNMIVVSRDAEGKNFRSDLRVDGGQESVFEMTLNRPGTYRFECGLHLPQMVGTITVQ